MRVKIFTTGGTIDKIYFDATSDFEVGEPQVFDILKEANVTVPFEIEVLMRKDSLDMTDEDRALIARRVREDPETHFLVTHGTDSMIDTARALEAIAGKTVVLVGSLAPARFKRSDAEFNIGFALGALQALPEGIYIAMNGLIFDPAHVRKNKEANRFEPRG